MDGKKMAVIQKEQARKIGMLLRRQTIDSEWVSAKYDELVQKFPNEYIAVRKRQVIDHSANYDSLVETLKRNFKNIDDITIEFISTKPVKLIL